MDSSYHHLSRLHSVDGDTPDRHMNRGGLTIPSNLFKLLGCQNHRSLALLTDNDDASLHPQLTNNL